MVNKEAIADTPKIERALLSAYKPERVIPLAEGLLRMDVELWATGGTRKALEEKGIKARGTDELTEIVSWFGGRVKTLTPELFGGILAPRTPEGLAEIKEHGITTFDVVAVDLYPFEETLKTPGATFQQILEKIDVGGPSMLRAAAKNHRYCLPMSSPAAERWIVLASMDEFKGYVPLGVRMSLAASVFQKTTDYDRAIEGWLNDVIKDKMEESRRDARRKAKPET